jgi:hypothetical protein
MPTVCYLCGNEIRACDTQSEDHRVPTLFIDRVQPKVRGFDYGGKQPTHETCNNRFPPEIHARNALDLLRVLHDPNCAARIRSKLPPYVSALALKSDCLSGFTPKELAYFRITDARDATTEELRNPSQLLGSETMDPFAIPRSTCLSVLAKSAAALLVGRHLEQVPARWRIIAFLGVVDISHSECERVFPGRQPFDKEVSVFIDPISDEDYSVVFRAHGTLAILAFQLSLKQGLIEALKLRFPNFHCSVFEGTNLMQMISHDWKEA